MHRALLVAVVMVLGAIPFGIDSVAAQSESTLEGIICSSQEEGGSADACYGGGIPDATVTLSSSSLLVADKTATTDKGGWFRFGGLSDGTYNVHVDRAGFEPYDGSIEVAGKAYLEASLNGLRVTQSGTVLAEDGSAISGASIALYGREAVEAESGAAGGFSAELTAGHYSVRISHPEFRTYNQYQLLDGQSEQTFTLAAAPERTVTLSGVVTDQDGKAVSGARIQAYQYGDCCYAYAEDGEASSSQGAPASEPSPDQPDSIEPASYPYYQDNQQETTTDANGAYTLSLYAGYANINAYKDGHANHWKDFEFKDGESRTHDFTMEKFPPKTARIEGKVVDASTGKGVNWISVSVESPRYGIHECSVESSQSSGSGDSMSIAPGEPYPGGNQCAITVNSDGSFSGDVTPGYSILRIYHQQWRACSETHDSDGSFRRECGPEYMQFVRTLDLPAESTTKLDVKLQQRPGPDATLSGYVVDKETQKALSGVRVSFSNQDSYSYAWAETDEDGSYKVRVRSGYHQVSVWADGYFSWEGVINVGSGKDVALDIHLVKGENRYGHCCYYYGDDAMTAESADAAPRDPSASSGISGSDGDQEGGTGDSFEDLGGGLGPYKSSQRAAYADQAGEVKESPGPGLFVMVGVVGLALLARRR